eukprot:778473_1
MGTTDSHSVQIYLCNQCGEAMDSRSCYDSDYDRSRWRFYNKPQVLKEYLSDHNRRNHHLCTVCNKFTEIDHNEMKWPKDLLKCSGCGKRQCKHCCERYTYNPAEPFAQGACRYAYKVYKDMGDGSGKNWLVMKKFKDGNAYTQDDWKGDIKCYAKAHQLVSAWNNLGIVDKKYYMQKPQLIKSGIHYKGGNATGYESKELESNPEAIKRNEYVLVEEMMDVSKYEKWNSNSGWFSNGKLSVQAFCHWTYHYSNGDLLFCDAQGVRDVQGYNITDPAILSKSGEYGCTDIGEIGMDQWFARHICNQFCDKKWIKPKNIGNNSLPVKKASTYKWQTKKI